MKALGQSGLDFIAGKYKELKELVGKKADKSEIKTKLSELTGDSTHRTVTDTEKTNWNNKVDKVGGKGLSTNDYDNTARALVEAIPTNPKYTDTITEVVDNLTTSDSTKALSAKQGKTLNDSLSGKADKSDISRCKTNGYSSASSWSSVSSKRDLEDWIGDFDKRTRELKGGSVESYDLTNKVTAYKFGRVVCLYFYNINTSDVQDVSLPSRFRPIAERVNFSIDNRLLNYRFGQISFSSSGDDYLGYPMICYISAE